eukprot:gene2651-3291_t
MAQSLSLLSPVRKLSTNSCSNNTQFEPNKYSNRKSLGPDFYSKKEQLQQQSQPQPQKQTSPNQRPVSPINWNVNNTNDDNDESPVQNNNNNNNNNVNNNNNNNNEKERPKLSKENSQKTLQLLQQMQSSSEPISPKNGDEILVRVWLPMEYTGSLYKVRKFSGGKTALEILTSLNSQLAPFYQSPKNKLFLNNEDKPIPHNLTLKELNLSRNDTLYLRREPEYEIMIPLFPNKGSLVLDKDIKVGEILNKIETWIGKDFNIDIYSSGGSGSNQQQQMNSDKPFYTTMEDHNLMNGIVDREGDNQFSSNYKLLKKLCLPTVRPNGRISRGYYLRLYDQKQISNYGIKIKDTLIFKKKAINRGLCVDDAEGGLEITVVYSPLSMLPTHSELDIDSINKDKDSPISPDKENGTVSTGNLIKLEKTLSIDDITSGTSSLKKKGKNRRTPSNVGLPFNIVHKTHVDFEYKWTGANVEESFEFKEKLGQGGYGAVFKVQHRETGFVLAVKVLSITPTRIKDIEKEIDLLKKCRCPNVLSYYGSIAKMAELWILMDYCAVDCICYFSQQLQTPYGQTNVLIGSPLYMAPELILKAPYNAKADVWSLGITLIELAEGRPPSRGLKSMAQLVEIPNMPPPKLSNPKDWSASFNDFISKCLIKDPEQRASVSELLSHPFVQNAKSIEVLNNMMKQCITIKDAQNRVSDQQQSSNENQIDPS